MAGVPKFGILERDGEEFFGPVEYVPDVTDILPTSKSQKPTFVNDLLTQCVWYSSDTQIEGNRVAQVDITYDSEEYPITVEYKLYSSTDGTVLIKTVSVAYTWSNSIITNIVRTIT